MALTLRSRRIAKFKLSVFQITLLVTAAVPYGASKASTSCPSGYSKKSDTLLHSLEITPAGSGQRSFLNGTWKGTWCSNGRRSTNTTLSYSGIASDPVNHTTWFSRITAKSKEVSLGYVIYSAVYAMKPCYNYVQGQPCDELLPEADVGTMVIGFSPSGYFVDENFSKYGSRFNQWGD